MPQVSIVVKNTSDKVQQFLIFSERPTYSESVGEAWNNVWGRSPGVGANHGVTEFIIDEHYYANEVKLGTDGDTSSLEKLEIQDGGAVFNKEKTDTLEKNGSFGIATASYDVTKYEHAFCGLGMKSPNPAEADVVPVSIWQAEPNQKYQITPKRTYYISTEKFVPGRVVDFAQLGKYATIVFTGRKETVATVSYTNEFDFLPAKYSFDN
ncbi:hypothetical protein ACHAP8_009887 [Fusarium lateritium]